MSPTTNPGQKGWDSEQALPTYNVDNRVIWKKRDFFQH